MSIIPDEKAELIRLQFKMELIRTICPILAIIMQTIVIIKIF
tara:strand:- start:326 stop:451 length:126 start_codon:yes stop_codon:yes gene_type:complete